MESRWALWAQVVEWSLAGGGKGAVESFYCPFWRVDGGRSRRERRREEKGFTLTQATAPAELRRPFQLRGPPAAASISSRTVPIMSAFFYYYYYYHQSALLLLLLLLLFLLLLCVRLSRCLRLERHPLLVTPLIHLYSLPPPLASGIHPPTYVPAISPVPAAPSKSQNEQRRARCLPRGSFSLRDAL